MQNGGRPLSQGQYTKSIYSFNKDVGSTYMVRLRDTAINKTNVNLMPYGIDTLLEAGWGTNKKQDK